MGVGAFIGDLAFAVIAGGPVQLDVQLTLFPTLCISEFVHPCPPFAEPSGSFKRESYAWHWIGTRTLA